MKTMYSIFDAKSRIWSNPFVAPNDLIATREFGRVVNEPGNAIHDNPEDFELHAIAAWDEEAGLLAPLPETQYLHHATALKKFQGI